MPIPAIIGASLISGASSILGNIFGASSQNRANQISMDFQREMYERQRQDALEDWTRNATYNSPQEQMKRLKAAGLNPNLVYGSANAIQTAQMPRAANAPTPNIKAPTFDFSMLAQIIPQMMQLKQTEAQTDNLKKQKDVLIQEAAYKAAQTANAIIQNEKINADIKKTKAETYRAQVDAQFKAFNLGMAQQLKQTSLEAAEQGLRKIILENQSRSFENYIQPKRWELESLQKTQNITESIEKILTLRAERGMIPMKTQEIQSRIENMRKDMELKQLDIDLKEKGIQPGDDIFWRIAARILEKYFPELTKEPQPIGDTKTLPGIRLFPY